MNPRRHRPSRIRRLMLSLHGWASDLWNARRNASAAYSARYILEDMDTPAGIEKLADATGLPEGVISAALRNILASTKEP